MGDIPCSVQQRGSKGLSRKDAPHSNMNLRRSSPGFTRSIVKEESESTMASKKLKLDSSAAESFEATSERHKLANISSLRARWWNEKCISGMHTISKNNNQDCAVTFNKKIQTLPFAHSAPRGRDERVRPGQNDCVVTIL